MIPKIEFVYSFPYDFRYKELSAMKKYLKERKIKYPSPERIRKFIKRIEKTWSKYENKILKEIEKITGLKWKDKIIKCYVVGIARGLSNPLTMKIDDPTRFIDILIHELVHQIQNKKAKFEKWFSYITKKYPKEHPITIRHIFVHAVCHQIYSALFTKKRLNEIIKFDTIPNYKNKKSSDEIIYYARSWQIVQEEGADNIIKKFRKVTK